MKKPTENQIIDFTLTTLSVNENRSLEKSKIKNHFSLDRQDISLINNSFETAERNGLIVFGGNVNSNAKLTKFGYEIIENGGWLNYLQKIEKESLFKNQKEELEFKKTKTELKLNNWSLKTKWIPHIISILSILFAVYVYFDSKSDSKKLEERLENLESIILNQKNVSNLNGAETKPKIRINKKQKA